MRIRHALATVAVGAALALGGLAAPAQAATQPAQGPVGAQDGWRYWGAYWTSDACNQAAREVTMSPDYEWAKCEDGYGTDGKYKWFLYVWA